MKVLFIASEISPFAKTGGLADVTGSLPQALVSQGVDVIMAMPNYRQVDQEKFNAQTVFEEFAVHLPGQTYNVSIKQTTLPATAIPVYLIDYPAFFYREELYTEKGKDYSDNAQRFALFCMATLVLLKALDWQPDIIHCHDWQTSLVPVYLKTYPAFRPDGFFQRTKTLLTIHNLAYQGIFPRSVLTEIALDDSLFHIDGLEFWGNVNLLKGGLNFADAINTVSPRYAKEIQTAEFGHSLEGLLKKRSGALYGILNGVNYNEWSPGKDKFIPANYEADNLAGKAICKKELQRTNNLPVDPAIPVIGMISRLAAQKGWDLLEKAIERLVTLGLQLIILGTGDPHYHQMLTEIGKKYPEKTGINLRFDEPLAHLIEAGADMFLMPSKFEPCGLNQLFSLKYGTVPIVHKTGGLADSIVNVTPAALKRGKATGFVFSTYSPKAMLNAINKAIHLYKTEPQNWKALMLNGMRQDFSWPASAKKYVKLYKKLLTA